MVRGQGEFGVLDKECFERWKPKGKEEWLTMTELARYVGRDVSWLRRLDRQKKLPVAARVKVGRLSVRLYSPKQSDEILHMFRVREALKRSKAKAKTKGVSR